MGRKAPSGSGSTSGDGISGGTSSTSGGSGSLFSGGSSSGGQSLFSGGSSPGGSSPGGSSGGASSTPSSQGQVGGSDGPSSSSDIQGRETTAPDTQASPGQTDTKSAAQTAKDGAQGALGTVAKALAGIFIVKTLLGDEASDPNDVINGDKAKSQKQTDEAHLTPTQQKCVDLCMYGQKSNPFCDIGCSPGDLDCCRSMCSDPSKASQCGQDFGGAFSALSSFADNTVGGINNLIMLVVAFFVLSMLLT